MNAFKKLAFVIISTLLLALLSCSSSGGGGGNPSVTSTVLSGKVVDGFVAGATVTAYQVNANGTQGAQIGTPVTTDQYGSYSLDLGSYSGPVYITSKGGTYIDTATGKPIDLTNSPLILSAIVPDASGNVTVQINPLTTIAADVALTFAGQGIAVATAADDANTLIQNYFGLTSTLLTTVLLDLTKASCMTGADQASANISAILAGMSQLAKNNGVSTPDLVEALIEDVASDGQFNGLASGTTISVLLTSGSGTIPLSVIEGTGLTGLANAITTFMTTSTSNICQATVDPGVISALSNTYIFPAPAGVTATPGNGQVTIAWTAVTGSTSYNIYWSTTPGVTPANGTQIPGATNPFVQTGLINGTTYYFVVTALNNNGESAPSTQVSATPSTPTTTWSGTAVDFATGIGVPDVAITVRAADLTNATLSTATTGSGGAFTATVPVSTPVYLHFVISGYANKNTQVKTLTSPFTSTNNAELFTDSVALSGVQVMGQCLSSIAWGDSCTSGKAWLAFGAKIADGSANAAGVTISAAPAGPIIEYNNSSSSSMPSYTGTSTQSALYGFPAAIGYNASSMIGSYVFTATNGVTSPTATMILNPGEFSGHMFTKF